MSHRLVSTRGGWCALIVCASLAASISVAAATGMPAAAALVPLAGAVIALVARGIRMRWSGVVALVLAAAALGVLRGAVADSPSAFDHAIQAGKVVLTGTVREGPGARRAANQVVIDTDRAALADGEFEAHGGVLATVRNAPSLLPGDRVQLDASALRLPHSTGTETALLRDGITAVAQSPTLTVLSEGGASLSRLLAVARGRLVAGVDAALPEPEASLVNDLAFAAPRSLPPDLTAALRDSGLAHMLATSGLKVVLVAGLVGSLLAALACPPRARLATMAVAVGG
jgi:predicted membrane metal-binding protein